MKEDSLKLQLSLLLDGELNPSESAKLLRRIENEPLLQAQWARYAIMSEAMRSGRVLIPDRGFVDKVSAALAEEPTVLAPRKGESQQIRERVVTGALAATLALVAVLVGKSLSEYSPIRGSEFLARSELMGPSVESIDPEFRDYLVMHYETAYLSGAQGMLPSVRLVSTDPVR